MRNYLIQYFRDKQIEYKEANDQFWLSVCVSCGGDKCYVSQTEGLWDCKKCGAKGNLNQFRKLLGDSAIDTSKYEGTKKAFVKKEYRTLQYNIPLQYASRLWGLEPEIQNYLLNERKLSKKILEKYKIGYNGKAISIPLYEKDVLVNIKYRRDPRKDKDENASPRYSQEKKCKPVLFNGNILNEPITTCYITEGSFDAMQLLQLGMRNVVGLTLGAGYFPKDWVEKFEDVKVIYLVYDNDQAGRDGAKNAANLLGVDRCKVVTLPIKEGRKKTDVTNYFIDDGYTKADFMEVVKDSKAVRTVEDDSIKHISEFSEDLRKRLLEGEYLGEGTGFDLLDDVMGGLRKGRLIVLSGLTSTGKTSFSLNVCLNVALKKHPVFYFSLEMPPIDIAKKILMLRAKLTNTQLKEIDDPSQTLKDVDKTLVEFSDIDSVPIYLYKSSGVAKYATLAECARLAKEEYGVECIFVDHLHYFARSTNNVTSETSIIVRDIKQLAMQLDIPIVLLTHLNRGGRSQQRKGLYIPTLSDLRDTGATEQDADQVLFVCRDSENEDTAERQKALIKVAKNRDGYAGRFISMRFDEELTTFVEEKKGVDHLAEIKEQKQEKTKEVLKGNEIDLPF